MEHNQYNIPPRISILLIGYFGKTLNEVEQIELDDWVGKSLDNQKVFENCVERSLQPVHHNFDEDEQRDMRYTAVLILKYLKNTITKEEQRYLNKWISASAINKDLLESLPRSVDLELLYHHLRLRVAEAHTSNN